MNITAMPLTTHFEKLHLSASHPPISGIKYTSARNDAIIVKGIIALLIRVLGDQQPQDILNADLYFIDRIGLSEHLSPTRSNGLLAMVKQMKIYASIYRPAIRRSVA